MAVTAKGEKRTKARVPRPGMLEVSLRFSDASGAEIVAAGTVVDSSEDGLGLQMRQAIPPGTEVVLSDTVSLRSAGIQVFSSARVCWCRPSFGIFWRIGLQYQREAPAEETQARQESPREEPPRSETRSRQARSESRPEASAPPASDHDLYEILEISPNATPDTIQRVYRLLAQRFHPDNSETGDAAHFRVLTAAYRTLSDPESRASYDATRHDHQKARWRVFMSPDGSLGAAAEKVKRHAVIRALYLKRMREPASPAIGMLELEDLLGIPRDHLEFTMWYLKERAMVARSDNNRYHILVAGVDFAEQLEEEAIANHKPLPDSRLLPAPRRS